MFKGFTIYGCVDHLGYVTKIICLNFGELIIRSLPMKGVRALRGYFGPPLRSKNKSCSLQVSSY